MLTSGLKSIRRKKRELEQFSDEELQLIKIKYAAAAANTSTMLTYMGILSAVLGVIMSIIINVSRDFQAPQDVAYKSVLTFIVIAITYWLLYAMISNSGKTSATIEKLADLILQERAIQKANEPLRVIENPNPPSKQQPRRRKR